MKSSEFSSQEMDAIFTAVHWFAYKSGYLNREKAILLLRKLLRHVSPERQAEYGDMLEESIALLGGES